MTCLCLGEMRPKGCSCRTEGRGMAGVARRCPSSSGQAVPVGAALVFRFPVTFHSVKDSISSL